MVAHALSQRSIKECYVDRLLDLDARELFMDTTKPSGDLSPKIEGISDEIVQMCNRVP